MHTYTFPHEHFMAIINHMSGLNITVSSLNLDTGVYTMVCETQIDAEQSIHLNAAFNLVEVI